ncbi:Thioredoxin, partial [uncultured virus]
VIKFTANWCGPCRRLAPLFEELASKYSDEVKFLEVDIDHADEITNHENVQSIPLMVFYDNGKKDDSLKILGCNPIVLRANVDSFVESVKEKVKESQKEHASDPTKLDSIQDVKASQEVKLVEDQIQSSESALSHLVNGVLPHPPDKTLFHLALDNVVETDSDDEDSEDSEDGSHIETPVPVILNDEESHNEYGQDCEIPIEKTIPEDLINENKE